MVAAFGRHETVFTVLGESARRRNSRVLIAQLIVSAGVAVTILLVAPHWFWAAFLAGWSAAYSAWGLVARLAESHEDHRRALNAVLATIATLGTALAVAGIIGVGLAIYSGDAASAKGTCGRNSSSKYCQAFKQPEKLTKLP